MKNPLLLVFISVFISLNTFSQTEIESRINNINVYRENAQITRDASFKLASGTQEIILTGISKHINPSSLQVQLTNSTLLSSKFESNYFSPNIEQTEKLKGQNRGIK